MMRQRLANVVSWTAGGRVDALRRPRHPRDSSAPPSDGASGAAQFTAIVNPVSGGASQAATLRAVTRQIRAAGHELCVQLTRGAGDATRLAAAVPDGTRAVLVVGGDGTAREVASALVGRDIPMVIARSGTENLLAKDLEMPTSPADLVEALLHGERCHSDIGRAGERRFFVVAGIGFDAEVVRRLHARRDGHIDHLDYAEPIWRTFWTHRFPHLDVEADGAQVYSGPGFAIVNVVPRYAVGLPIAPRARRDDGLLDLTVFPCSNCLRLLGHAAAVMLGRNGDLNGAIMGQAQRIRISSPQSVPVQLDGDDAGTLPVTLTVEPSRALFLRLPARRGP